LRVPVGKLHNDRYVPLHPQLVELLDTHHAGRDDDLDRLIIWNGGGSPLRSLGCAPGSTRSCELSTGGPTEPAREWSEEGSVGRGDESVASTGRVAGPLTGSPPTAPTQRTNRGRNSASALRGAPIQRAAPPRR
jgi:hypothetical protein